MKRSNYVKFSRRHLAIESDVAHITFVGKCLEVLDEYVVDYDGDSVLVLRAELPLPLHPGKP